MASRNSADSPAQDSDVAELDPATSANGSVSDDDEDDEDEDDDSSGPQLNDDGTRTKKISRGISADASAKAASPFTGVDRSFNMDVNLPGTVEDYRKKYGDKIVLKLLDRAALSAAAAATRIPLVEGQSDEAIQKIVLDRIENLGTRRTRGPVDPKAALRKQLEGKTQEEKATFFREMFSDLGIDISELASSTE